MAPASTMSRRKVKRYPEYKCEMCRKRYRILGNYQKHMLLKHIQKGF